MAPYHRVIPCDILAIPDGAVDALKPIFGDGIILTSIASVSLNAFFNRKTKESAERDRFLAAWRELGHWCVALPSALSYFAII